MSVGYSSVLFASKFLIKKCGRLSSVFVMYMLLACELLIFGLAKYSSSNALFIALCLICRLG